MPPKGKQGTKGQKQIVEENKKTLAFYQNIILTVNIIYFGVEFIFFWDSFTALEIIMSCLAGLVYFGSFRFMKKMATPTWGEESTLLDGGIDLNLESGMAEHCKDIILMTVIVELLSLISNYFWLLWLLVPGRAFYLLWVNVLAPWFFEAPPEENEKKQRKLERKMRRH